MVVVFLTYFAVSFVVCLLFVFAVAMFTFLLLVALRKRTCEVGLVQGRHGKKAWCNEQPISWKGPVVVR